MIQFGVGWDAIVQGRGEVSIGGVCVCMCSRGGWGLKSCPHSVMQCASSIAISANLPFRALRIELDGQNSFSGVAYTIANSPTTKRAAALEAA